MTKCRKLGGSNNRSVLSYSPGDQKSKVLAGLVPSEECEGESVPCLSPNLWFTGNVWHSLVYRSITLISAFFAWRSPYGLSVSTFPVL